MPIEFSEVPNVVTIREVAARGPQGEAGSGGGGSGSGVVVSSTPPSDPEPGDLWVDTGTEVNPSGFGSGIRLTSYNVAANFAWLIHGSVVQGHGSITYLWAPEAGNGIGIYAGIVGAPVADLPIVLALLVRNLTGDEVITMVDGSATTEINEGVLHGYALRADSDVAVHVGSDLSYNTESNEVISAAGGIFLVQALVEVIND